MAIHIALAKGRIHKAVMNYLQESGYEMVVRWTVTAREVAHVTHNFRVARSTFTPNRIRTILSPIHST